METNDFDSSSCSDDVDHDVDCVYDELPLTWLSADDLSTLSGKVAVSALPGCRFKNVRRSLFADISMLHQCNVTDVFCFCTDAELKRYRVPNLISAYEDAGMVVHRFPFLDGDVLPVDQCLLVIHEVISCISEGRIALLHCMGGLGRSAMVAAVLLLQLHSTYTANTVIDRMRELRGIQAIQTVKQYNFLHDWHDNVQEILITGGSGWATASFTSETASR